MTRVFYLSRSEPLTSGGFTAWQVGGILKTYRPDGTISFVDVSVSGADKYDALCRLDYRLEGWGVRAEDIHPM